MSNEKEYRAAVKRLTRARLELDKTASDVAATGRIQNWGGTFWDKKKFDDLCQLYETAISLASDVGEGFGLRYSYAAIKRDALMLDEAIHDCEQLIERDPRGADTYRHLQAFAEARRGNLRYARELADRIRNNPNATAFFIPDEDLVYEYNSANNRGDTNAGHP